MGINPKVGVLMGEKQREIETQTEAGGHVKTEAEARVMLPHAEEHSVPPKLQESRMDCPLTPQRERSLAHTFRLLASEPGRINSCYFKPPTYGILL